MTAKEAIANLRLMGHQPIGYVAFLYLAAHADEARLAGGERLNDATDFAAWLIELANAVRAQEPATLNPALNRTCPRCGHVHQGEAECGEPLGGGRICRCEFKVQA
jgi:hypothetical protein